MPITSRNIASLQLLNRQISHYKSVVYHQQELEQQSCLRDFEYKNLLFDRHIEATTLMNFV